MARAEWQSITDIKVAVEEPYTSALSAFFAEQEREVMRDLERVLAQQGFSRKSLNAGVKIDPFVVSSLLPESWEDVLRDLIQAFLGSAAETGYRTGALRIDIEVENFRPSALTTDVMDLVLSRAQGVNGHTRSEIMRILQRGLREERSIPWMVARIQEQFQDWSGWRANLIAQTTTTPVFEVSQMHAYTDAGIGQHKWLSMRDARVRKEHLAQDHQDQAVKIGEVFPLAGVRFPGDPAAEDASDVIGCRCSTLPYDPLVTPTRSVAVSSLHDLTEGMNDREKARVDLAVRDMEIRKAYPALRDEHGQHGAYAILAEQHHVSESTVKRAVVG